MADYELEQAKDWIKRAIEKIGSTKPKDEGTRHYKEELLEEMKIKLKELDVLISYDKGYDRCFDAEKEGRETPDSCECGDIKID